MSNATTTLDYVSLDAAVAALGSTATTLTISTALSVVANTTVPRTLTLEFTGSGSLAVPTGVTVTINGPIQAPLKRIFFITGTGTVTLTVATEVYPEWWGAIADGVTDSTNALQAAINSQYVGKVRLSSGQYLYSTVLTIPSNVYIEGNDPAGGFATVLRPNNCAAFIVDNVHHSIIEHLTVWPKGATPPASVVTIGATAYCYAIVFRDVRFHFDATSYTESDSVIRQSNGQGILFDDVIIRHDTGQHPIIYRFDSSCGSAVIRGGSFEDAAIGIKHLGGRIMVSDVYSEGCVPAIYLSPSTDAEAAFTMLGGVLFGTNSSVQISIQTGAKNVSINGTYMWRPDLTQQGHVYDLTGSSNIYINLANYDPAKWTWSVPLDPAIITFPKLNRTRSVTVTYSASMNINASTGDSFLIVATNNTAFTINAPTAPLIGQRIRFRIKNTSAGALGAATWNAVFKMGAAWTQPASGKSRCIDFENDGTNWIETGRTAVDVSN